MAGSCEASGVQFDLSHDDDPKTVLDTYAQLVPRSDEQAAATRGQASPAGDLIGECESSAGQLPECVSCRLGIRLAERSVRVGCGIVERDARLGTLGQALALG